MAQQSSIFPIYLRAEYRDGTALQRFQSDAQRAAQAASGEIKKVGAALDSIFAKRGSGGGLDLGVGNLKAAIDAQQQLAIAAREVANATKAAATENGGFDAALSRTAKAAFDNAKAQEQQLAALQAQLPLLQRVQAELSKNASAASALVGENLRLAQAEAAAANGAAMLEAIYRGTALELGRVANSARESASAFELLFQAQDARSQAAGQAFFNAAAGLDRQAKSARDSAAAFEALFAEQEQAAVAARRITDTYLSLAQAEAAAVNGATMLQAALRGTALEQDRVTKSARESAQVFEEAFAKQEAAAKATAAALAALKAQINPAAVAQAKFNEAVAFAKSQLDLNTLSQKEYAQAVRLAASELRAAGQAEVAAAAARNGLTTATNLGTTARGNVINSIRAERTAFIQFGQQLQDIGIQAQFGTSMLTILTQQVPQAAFALTGLADSADKTKAAIGRAAVFLGNPWLSAVFAATAILGPYIVKLFESSDAAGKSASSISDLVAQKQRASQEARNNVIAEDIYAKTLDGVTDSIERNRKALAGLNSVHKTAAQLAVENAKKSLDEAEALRLNTLEQLRNAMAIYEAQRARASGPGQGSEVAALGLGDAARKVEALIKSTGEATSAIKTLRGQLRDAQISLAIEDGQRGEEDRIRQKYATLVDGLRKSARARGLSEEAIKKEAAALKAREEAEVTSLRPSRRDRRERSDRRDRSAEVAARAAAREVEQLANMGERAAEQVQRISERFDEQPRLIDQAAQASRQLSAIVRDINTELATSKNLTADQRKEFEGIKKAAADAQDTIGNALLRPFQDLRRESDQRLQIQKLLSEGRVDEAAGLQEIFRIEQQLGTKADLRAKVQKLIAEGDTEQAAKLSAFIDGYDDLLSQAGKRVASEQRVTREYQAQRELLELQADVARTVADDLRRLLSGRSTDFFKNFQQAILDLQGARLFEKLFGPTFRALEDELSGNTPQGRANARAAREIETFADTGRRAERALDSLANSAESAASRLAGRGAANDNGLSVPQVKTLGGLLGAALGGGSAGDTVEDGKQPTEIATRSVKDIAERIAKETVAGFMGPLEDLLGPKLTASLGSVLSGALAGYIRGGAPGAVLGGLQSITSKIKGLEGITKGLGKALGGAETGSQIGAIGKALGIKGSNTGAQIGGAIGSFLPIPGGSIIGSIAGFIIGGLFKSVKKASATIGNLGGSLGVTSLTGSNAAYRDAASGLGGSVVEAINSVAKQLGAKVDGSAGAVSIGQYDKSYVVDPTGRGITKPKKGAIDFGDDAQAAVAFAVRNLIQDGVIKGLKDSENRLLQAAKDVNAGLQDVLTFRGVFDQLKAIKDPVGGAIDSLNREFESLIDLFNRAGASTEEFAQLQELYDFKRADAIKQATDKVVGSLRSLLNDLKTGDNGLSLRDRQANALTQYNALAARVAAGDTSAFDDFANVSKQLLEIERQLFGSTQAYFDRLAQVTKLSEEAIAKQTAGGTDPATAPSPFAERDAIVKSLDAGTAETVAWLRAINDNLIRLAGGASGGGSGGGDIFSAQRIVNF